MKSELILGLVLLGAFACSHEEQQPPPKQGGDTPATQNAGKKDDTGLTDDAKGVLNNVGTEVDKATYNNLNVDKPKSDGDPKDKATK